MIPHFWSNFDHLVGRLDVFLNGRRLASFGKIRYFFTFKTNYLLDDVHVKSSKLYGPRVNDPRQISWRVIPQIPTKALANNCPAIAFLVL